MIFVKSLAAIIKCVTFPCDFKGFCFNYNIFYQIKVFKTTLFSVKYFTCQFPLLEVCCAEGLSVWTVWSSGPASLTCPLSGLFLVISTLDLLGAILESAGNESNPAQTQINTGVGSLSVAPHCLQSGARITCHSTQPCSTCPVSCPVYL